VNGPGDRRPPISPQLALRVAMLGGLALLLFGVVFFRLWYLQVLSGDQYLAQANTNRVRDITIQAPRGNIVGRNDEVLVRNRQAQAIQLQVERLPRDRAARMAQYRRLAQVIGGGLTAKAIAAEVEQQKQRLPYANVTIKTDARREVYLYLSERQDQFPAVRIQPVYLRQYPHHALAGQLFGTVGEITGAQIAAGRRGDDRYRDIPQGTVIGQSGLELAYDRYLRGRDGAIRVSIDALGNPQGFLRERAPVQGRQIKLSLDLGLQEAAQRAVERSIALAHANGHWGASAGGFVAMDPRNGEILALGSVPSFDPNVFSRPLTEQEYKRIERAPGAPLYNRATSGLYPTGSTFKPITALAGLSTGLIDPYTTIVDTGCITISDQQRCNAGKAAYGPVNLRRALQVSSDIYFYKLGAALNPLRGQPLQTWAERLGLGQLTGVEGGEAAGEVPDRRWRADRAEQELRCERARGVPSCGISDKRPWSVGDNVNLAIGQGDLQVTPLQMARAYAVLANGGTLVRPHLGIEVQDASGRLLQELDRPPAKRIRLPRASLDAIRDGLHLAASAPGGTSADVFAGWPQSRLPVFGKTGTAQTPQGDQSWYVAWVPHKSKPIVVAVTIEQGGFGAQSAAPAARMMLAHWFDVPDSGVSSGSSRTN
jgi:penicillin-binding protein 2